jgi:hypothetical protein
MADMLMEQWASRNSKANLNCSKNVVLILEEI